MGVELAVQTEMDVEAAVVPSVEEVFPDRLDALEDVTVEPGGTLGEPPLR
jgi:hypothetical protein